MTLKILTNSNDAPLAPLVGRTVSIIGYGNQGAAHALNLRDSGIDVRIGCRAAGPSEHHARAHDFTVQSIESAAECADLVILALPDEAHGDVWLSRLNGRIQPGGVLGVMHGFSVHAGMIEPPKELGVVMVAPKGPGTTLRKRFLEGKGIPCLFSVHQPGSDAARTESIGLAWANGVGCARAAIVYTTIAVETETDQFGEQAVLCGGMTWMMLAAFETLVEAGYPPELAYLECCQELKQVADLIYEHGPSGMMNAISNTAEFGAFHAGPVIVDELVRTHMRELLAKVQSGAFAKQFMAAHDHGFADFEQARNELKRHAIEEAGRRVRQWFASNLK